MNALVVNCSGAEAALLRLVLAAVREKRSDLDISTVSGDVSVYLHVFDGMSDRRTRLTDIPGLHTTAAEVERRALAMAATEQGTTQ